jgi:hypothetical protein
MEMPNLNQRNLKKKINIMIIMNMMSNLHFKVIVLGLFKFFIIPFITLHLKKILFYFLLYFYKTLPLSSPIFKVFSKNSSVKFFFLKPDF